MIATRIRLFPRRVVEAFFLFLAIAMTSDFYLSLIESWRPTWTTRRTNVIVERTARAKIAATKIASTSNTAHAARPLRKMTMRAAGGFRKLSVERVRQRPDQQDEERRERHARREKPRADHAQHAAGERNRVRGDAQAGERSRYWTDARARALRDAVGDDPVAQAC